jgi:hypothetical protein
VDDETADGTVLKSGIYQKVAARQELKAGVPIRRPSGKDANHRIGAGLGRSALQKSQVERFGRPTQSLDAQSLPAFP